MKHDDKNGWRSDIAPYERPHMRHSVWQILNTIIPFFALWYFAYLSLSVSIWLTLVIDIIASGFLVRIFIIFHDCCHKSFFKNKWANEIVGTLTGILTFVPYHQWRYTHSIHHASSGNLDRRGVGDIWTLTVDEYQKSSWKKRLTYRLYRNPLIMFIIGPIFIFLIDYRFNRKRAGMKERMNTYITNVSIVGSLALLCWAIGWQSVLLIQGPMFFVSGMMGIWLFYVQHNYEETYFENEPEWDYVKAAMHGSSFYKLPRVLHWITGNIGFHHIHHLSPRVPNYYLEKVHNKNAVLRNVQTITLMTSLESLKFRIWCEDTKKFIRFKDLKPIKVKRSLVKTLEMD
ncbi:fatty acid desaturase [Paenibacillus anseongense]|uniref:fatty acid desaturase n=1 Tax=Paenibacillus TaxID=44249 RepID=UPI002DB6EA3A|nr:fatty acid desaturase [Paenibacillus anseongense]MEC0266737.1 fatty acid desaturase [Paenibacillus anseongense]